MERMSLLFHPDSGNPGGGKAGPRERTSGGGPSMDGVDGGRKDPEGREAKAPERRRPPRRELRQDLMPRPDEIEGGTANPT